MEEKMGKVEQVEQVEEVEQIKENQNKEQNQKEEQEDTPKDHENQEEEEEENQEEGEEHPIDKLSLIIEDIESQERRLSNRNAGDLKYELTKNIYPILKSIISSVIELAFNDDDEENENDSDENENMEEIEKAIENETKEIKEICKIILENKETNNEKVVLWAEKFMKKLEEINNV
jgi:ABC-type Zn2+ transport system substrate-binding protein/surface adhesin